MIAFSELPLAPLLNWIRSKLEITRDMVLPGSIPLTGLDTSTGTIPNTAVPGTSWGNLGYAQVVANQTIVASGTETDLTNLTVTVTVGTNRKIRLSAQGILSRTVADGATIGRFKEGSTELGRWAQHSPSAAGEFNFAYGALQSAPLGSLPGGGNPVFLTPSAGTHTYKLTLQRFSGTGNVTLNAGTTSVAFIAVDDMGPA